MTTHPANPPRPLVGVACDVADNRAALRLAYLEALRRAGADAIILPPIPEQAERHARLCDAFVLTGGDDPIMESFGAPTHPNATRVDPRRQAHDVALLAALDRIPAAPVLGVCLGMQYMAICAGGALNQHMPDDTPTHADHYDNRPHPVAPTTASNFNLEGVVTSHHRQAVSNPGRLRIIARAHDGVIEAVDDPARPFYLGVQWHPERTETRALGQALFDALVRAIPRA
ncbi:MAG: gamma-glutamyl-gamma-aminobutyrate hydrolase family protein [Planctomycetota bacterium]|nr:gamma-glutamyl-gamma-aminobutyrate hydrolase family protein [Planctomycetota bacterium]